MLIMSRTISLQTIEKSMILRVVLYKQQYTVNQLSTFPILHLESVIFQIDIYFPSTSFSPKGIPV